jgi:hypothetical protein
MSRFLRIDPEEGVAVLCDAAVRLFPQEIEAAIALVAAYRASHQWVPLPGPVVCDLRPKLKKLGVEVLTRYAPGVGNTYRLAR